MTRIRISHSWRTIRGTQIRIVHRRKVAVKAGSSISPNCISGNDHLWRRRGTIGVKVSPSS